MKILIAEDDFITGQVMLEILSSYGNCDLVTDGQAAINYVQKSIESNDPYNVLFLDIMMPEKTGQEALDEIRNIEYNAGFKGLDCLKVIMTTALDDFENIRNAFKNQCDGYIVKPIDVEKIVSKLNELELI